MSGRPGVVQFIPRIADLTTMTTGSPLLRARLIDMITESPRASLTLITAPAGYGKSTLVSQWVRSGCHKAAWVALGPESNSPGRFLSQLAKAVEWAWQGWETSAHDLGSIDGIAGFLRSVAQDDQRPTLVFDDYHHIENQDVNEAMDSLVRCLAGSAYVILIGRIIPSLSLGRLQVEGAVRHVTEADLRFTPEEGAEVVRQEAPGRLTDSQIASLVERTEGWIAGIRLALVSLERIDPASVPSLIDAWPVHQWLDDYIVEEVLTALPEDVRTFVLRTVILSELTPALCNAVLGIETGARLIDESVRRLVFARPSETGEGMSYHPLFAESVQRIADRRWPTSDRRDRHRRAACWYEAQGQLEAAVEHAVRAEAWEIADRCLRPLCKALMDIDRHHSRLYWLRKLPEARVLADPHLARWYISALQYSGRLREARRALAVVDPAWQASGDPVQRGYSDSARCFIAMLDAEYDLALQLSYEALEHYPPAHAVDRLHSWTTVSQIAFHKADDDLAAFAHGQAEQCREWLPPEQWWWASHVAPTRGNQEALRGNLRTAYEMYRVALDELPGVYQALAAKIQFRLAAIALEWNALDEAADRVALIEHDLNTFPRTLWHLDALVVVARVYEAVGDTEQLKHTISRLWELYRQYGGRNALLRLEALEVPAWLHSGKQGLAGAWAKRVRIADQPWIDTFGDIDARLVVAQVMIAGGQHARAHALLSGLIEHAREFKRWAEIVPLCVWHAVACVELGDDAGALASLRTALQHGMRGGFVRSFLTMGYELGPFVDTIRNDLSTEELAYARQVIPSMAPRMGELSSASDEVAEPVQPVVPQVSNVSLSAREMQVLELLHAGCANKEIGQRLFLADSTVKKYVSRVLRKLSVSNRTAAVRRAHELGLL